MTKEQNILNLYEDLDKNGARGKAITFMSEVFGVGKRTIKNHWLQDKELPKYLSNPLNGDKEKVNKQLDQVITYLQNAIRLQN